MSAGAQTVVRHGQGAGSRRPVWWVVFAREFVDLWMGGKGLTLILVYSLSLGLWSYVLASNTEMSLIPPKEMVWQMLEATIALGCFVCLIGGADSISGDRERATLEGLLLTPTSRRQLVLGKFLAVISLWPGIMLITTPYLAVLAQGDEILWPAVLWCGFLGGALVVGLTGVGMLASIWSNTVKTSMAVSLGVYLLIYMPQLLPGHMQMGVAGKFLQKVSPLMAAFEFLAKILVNHRTVAERAFLLYAPILFPIVVLGLLFLVAGPGLRLEAGQSSRLRSLFGRFVGVVAVVGMLGFSGAAVASTLGTPGSPPAQASQEMERGTIELAIDVNYREVSQGDSVLYKTIITNHGDQATPQLTVAMNIINLNVTGNIVDPEDWSPQRTQYIETLGPGETVTLSWRVNAIINGDYMVYMVVIPSPTGMNATTVAVSGPAIHLTVNPRTVLNPRGVLGYVIGTPLALGLAMFVIYRRRRRSTQG